MRRTTIAAFALVLTCVLAAPAVAHEGDPRFDSVLTGAGVPGLKVQVLDYGDRLLLRNATGETVTLVGYEGEPYARMLADGTVEVNERSPAAYLNDDPYGRVTVPETADAQAAPRWRRTEGGGRFETHDHRIHWMSPGGAPDNVTDPAARTKVFDWSVPVQVGDGPPAAITGTLWWRGSEETGGGMPVGAIAGLGGLALASLVLVVGVRRRRAGRDEPPAEAW